MCYVITDCKSFIGKDFFGRPTLVSTKEKACTFKTELSASNFLKCIPDAIKRRESGIHIKSFNKY